MRHVKSFFKKNNNKRIEASGGAGEVSIPLGELGKSADNKASERAAYSAMYVMSELGNLELQAQDLLKGLKKGTPDALLRSVTGLLQIGSDKSQLIAKQADLKWLFKEALYLAAISSRSPNFAGSDIDMICRLVKALCELCDGNFNTYKDESLSNPEMKFTSRRSSSIGLFYAPKLNALDESTQRRLRDLSLDGLDDSAPAASAPGR